MCFVGLLASLLGSQRKAAGLRARDNVMSAQEGSSRKSTLFTSDGNREEGEAAACRLLQKWR